MKYVCIAFIYILSLPILLDQPKQKKEQNNYNIKWEKSSLKLVAPLTGNRPANYARIIQLSNGSLFCVYECAGAVECTKSYDLGNSWLPAVVIAPPQEKVNVATPEILELKDHSLLVSYNPRPRTINGIVDTSLHFAIRTKKSYDTGMTWQNERLIYEAGYKFEDGCWEPAQIQLPSGEIQLYFSDEGVYTQSNEQNISIFRSMDNGLTWSIKPQVVSFTPHHRDGMPVPVILYDGNEILFSIEDNVNGQFKPAIIRNSTEQNWQPPVGIDDKNRIAAFTPSLPDTVYAGAPYLRQLHSGQTILSYQSTMNRHRDWQLACMQVAIGTDDARNFKNVDAPFQIPADKHGLWNSLCVLKDDTIIAVTSTDAYGGNTAIWMIKGRLVNKKAE